MKKFIITSICSTLLISSQSFGQNLSFGIKAGCDMTTIKENISELNSSTIKAGNYNYIPSFQIGMTCKYSLKESYGIYIEPGFIQKGAQTNNTFKFNYRLGYFDTPILIYYYPITKLNFEIGPEFGYQLYEKAITQNGGSSNLLLNNRFDFCALIGLNYDFNSKFNLGLRYSYSLTSMTYDLTNVTDQNNNYLGNQRIYDYNRYFEIYLRYYFIKI